MATIQIGDRFFTLETDSDVYHLRYIAQALHTEIILIMREAKNVKGEDHQKQLNKVRETVARYRLIWRAVNAVVEFKQAIGGLPKEITVPELASGIMRNIIDNLQNAKE
jgi:predicted RND superfamily exporter protein